MSVLQKCYLSNVVLYIPSLEICRDFCLVSKSCKEACSMLYLVPLRANKSKERKMRQTDVMELYEHMFHPKVSSLFPKAQTFEMKFSTIMNSIQSIETMFKNNKHYRLIVTEITYESIFILKQYDLSNNIIEINCSGFENCNFNIDIENETPIIEKMNLDSFKCLRKFRIVLNYPYLDFSFIFNQEDFIEKIVIECLQSELFLKKSYDWLKQWSRNQFKHMKIVLILHNYLSSPSFDEYDFNGFTVAYKGVIVKSLENEIFLANNGLSVESNSLLNIDKINKLYYPMRLLFSINEKKENALTLNLNSLPQLNVLQSPNNVINIAYDNSSLCNLSKISGCYPRINLPNTITSLTFIDPTEQLNIEKDKLEELVCSAISQECLSLTNLKKLTIKTQPRTTYSFEINDLRNLTNLTYFENDRDIVSLQLPSTLQELKIKLGDIANGVSNIENMINLSFLSMSCLTKIETTLKNTSLQYLELECNYFHLDCLNLKKLFISSVNFEQTANFSQLAQLTSLALLNCNGTIIIPTCLVEFGCNEHIRIQPNTPKSYSKFFFDSIDPSKQLHEFIHSRLEYLYVFDVFDVSSYPYIRYINDFPVK